MSGREGGRSRSPAPRTRRRPCCSSLDPRCAPHRGQRSGSPRPRARSRSARDWLAMRVSRLTVLPTTMGGSMGGVAGLGTSGRLDAGCRSRHGAVGRPGRGRRARGGSDPRLRRPRVHRADRGRRVVAPSPTRRSLTGARSSARGSGASLRRRAAWGSPGSKTSPSRSRSLESSPLGSTGPSCGSSWVERWRDCVGM